MPDPWNQPRLALDDAPLVERTAALTRGVVRLFDTYGYASLLEVPLGNGRRADVVSLARGGDIIISEVKSGPSDFRADHKWQDYLNCCDRFYFVVAQDFPSALLEPHLDRVGVIVADAYGGAQAVEAPRKALKGAQRSRLMQRLARIGALRSQAAFLVEQDPVRSHGIVSR